MSSPIYFGVMSLPPYHTKSSSTLLNIARFFGLPTHVLLSHVFSSTGMFNGTDEQEIVPPVELRFGVFLPRPVFLLSVISIVAYEVLSHTIFLSWPNFFGSDCFREPAT